jgi:hypothetical protein
MDSGLPDAPCPDFRNPGRRIPARDEKPIKIKLLRFDSSWHRPCEIDNAAATVRQLKQGDNDV